ncbi:MAG: XdhC family protein, partial [Burkholderiaceae bacterium]
MSDALRALAIERLAQAAASVVVEVVATRGSVPREAGTRMLVWSEDGAGTIGGGHLEWQAIAKARAGLMDPSQWPEDEEIALGASLGQCCGGAVTLRYRRLDDAALADWPAEESAPFIQLYGAGHVGRAIARLFGTLEVRVQWTDEREDEFPSGASTATIER